MPLPPSKLQVLRLYKHLIRYGNQLKFTDKTYFINRIKSEFHENSIITDPKKIEYCFKRGETLLKKSRVL